MQLCIYLALVAKKNLCFISIQIWFGLIVFLLSCFSIPVVIFDLVYRAKLFIIFSRTTKKTKIALINIFNNEFRSERDDRLEEIYGEEFPSVNSKTVFNFVSNIRTVYKLPKVSVVNERVYMKQEESAYGAKYQVDFGQYLMLEKRKIGLEFGLFASYYADHGINLFIFKTALLHLSVQLKVTNWLLSIFEAQAKELIYDQDRTFMVERKFR